MLVHMQLFIMHDDTCGRCGLPMVVLSARALPQGVDRRLIQTTMINICVLASKAFASGKGVYNTEPVMQPDFFALIRTLARAVFGLGMGLEVLVNQEAGSAQRQSIDGKLFVLHEVDGREVWDKLLIEIRLARERATINKYKDTTMPERIDTNNATPDRDSFGAFFVHFPEKRFPSSAPEMWRYKNNDHPQPKQIHIGREDSDTSGLVALLDSLVSQLKDINTDVLWRVRDEILTFRPTQAMNFNAFMKAVNTSFDVGGGRETAGGTDPGAGAAADNNNDFQSSENYILPKASPPWPSELESKSAYWIYDVNYRVANYMDQPIVVVQRGHSRSSQLLVDPGTFLQKAGDNPKIAMMLAHFRQLVKRVEPLQADRVAEVGLDRFLVYYDKDMMGVIPRAILGTESEVMRPFVGERFLCSEQNDAARVGVNQAVAEGLSDFRKALKQLVDEALQQTKGSNSVARKRPRDRHTDEGREARYGSDETTGKGEEHMDEDEAVEKAPPLMDQERDDRPQNWPHWHTSFPEWPSTRELNQYDEGGQAARSELESGFPSWVLPKQNPWDMPGASTWAKKDSQSFRKDTAAILRDLQVARKKHSDKIELLREHFSHIIDSHADVLDNVGPLLDRVERLEALGEREASMVPDSVGDEDSVGDGASQQVSREAQSQYKS